MNASGTNAPATVISVLLLLAAFLVLRMNFDAGWLLGYAVPGVLFVSAILVRLSMLMAKQWERAVVLRLGKLHAIRGPGIFLVVPFVDSVTAWIDQRIQTTPFNAEQALTRDTVPVNIDAILFWQIHDPERAALEITDYHQAILRVAQTTLREMIGSSPLSAILSERQAADLQLKEDIGRKTAEWGIAAVSVELRDVAIPAQLQDAMSRQAQAEREKQARIILGSAELEVAQKFLDAANIYAQNPTALQLRAMNIIYETTKERGSTILIPSSMVDSMNPGGVLGLAAVASARQTPAPESQAAQPPLIGPASA
jgi:hypothetical protein